MKTILLAVAVLTLFAFTYAWDRCPDNVAWVRLRLPIGRFSAEELCRQATLSNKQCGMVVSGASTQDICPKKYALEDTPVKVDDLIKKLLKYVKKSDCPKVCALAPEKYNLYCNIACKALAKKDAVVMSDRSCAEGVKWVREQLKYGTPRSVASLCQEAGLPSSLASKVGAGLPVELICK
jgi:hypothetical protein